ncbi:hypothetical protein RPPS3_25410 [Rhodopseudomonas palustris]|uniref:hypothetical protein n=1 Tax=Rhodopseudomonas palustris TaxID=1076 RepID=UPI000D19846E|nr:hypothetical protein [Rhodopseudomonas palustris]AVT76604.1 hypothetical protein RPPS3_25410 [Rhodopseudomonas palustris]
MTEPAPPFNPFTGTTRARLLLLAGLLLKRQTVSDSSIRCVLSNGEGVSQGYAESHVTELRRQLPSGVLVLRERGVGYYVNDKAKLAAFLRGEVAR